MLGLSLPIGRARPLQVLSPTTPCQPVAVRSSTLDALTQALIRSARSKAATTLGASLLEQHLPVLHQASSTVGPTSPACGLRRRPHPSPPDPPLPSLRGGQLAPVDPLTATIWLRT